MSIQNIVAVLLSAIAIINFIAGTQINNNIIAIGIAYLISNQTRLYFFSA